jgi:toxin ParE1/3/4
MIVVVSAAAAADLEAIGDWIALDSPARAVTFVSELRRACGELAHEPWVYSLVPRYEHAGIRRRVYGNYLVFFRIAGEVVEIIHVMHGAREYEAIIFPKG